MVACCSCVLVLLYLRFFVQASMGGWGMPGGMQGGWGMPPPVPPPGWGGMQGAPQAQQQHPGYMTGGYMGVPPPPPPSPLLLPRRLHRSRHDGWERPSSRNERMESRISELLRDCSRSCTASLIL